MDLPQDCPDPTRCPKCGGNFLKTKIDFISYALGNLMDAYDFRLVPNIEFGYTYLFVCEQCQWWYIRLAYSYGIERSVYEVYITYGVDNPEAKLKSGYTTPWDQALHNDEKFLLDDNLLSPFTGDIRDMFQKAMKVNPITKPYR
jgi:hypothetical protein